MSLDISKMQENIDVKKSIGELRHREQRSLEWKTIGVKVRIPESTNPQ